MIVVAPDFWVLFTRIILTSAILALYSYDWFRVYAKWSREPKRTRGIQFRSLIRASVLCLIVVVVLINSINVTFFNTNEIVRDILRFVSYVLIGTALVGGIALVADWRREEATA